MKLFLTGKKQVGKSTAIQCFLKESGLRPGGFFTSFEETEDKRILHMSSMGEELKTAVSNGEIQISFKFNAETGRPDTYLNGVRVEEEIRNMAVSSRVSPIAALPFVRSLLTEQQQAMGEKKGIVMDGRDIGTAVFPNAELKIFVTASAKVRAQRRYDELMNKAKTEEEKAALNYEEILKNVEERDYIDSHRETAPLRKAEDAIILDNSEMTIEEQNSWLLEKYQEKIKE